MNLYRKVNLHEVIHELNQQTDESSCLHGKQVLLLIEEGKTNEARRLLLPQFGTTQATKKLQTIVRLHKAIQAMKQGETLYTDFY